MGLGPAGSRVTLLLWFIYLAYLLLRSFTEGSARTARFAAVYGIAGVFAIPLNYFAIELFGGAAMHPDNLERGSLGAGMGWPFAVGVATGLAAYLHLLLLRTDLESLRAEAVEAEPALGPLNPRGARSRRGRTQLTSRRPARV